MSDVIPFFRAWAFDPWRVASIVPSSRALGQLITSEISPASAPVLELGAGTGVFTRALLGRGLRQEQLTLVENGGSFADLLRLRFPHARILCSDAAQLRHIGWQDGERPGAVVSGLPLLSMPPRKVIAVLDGAFGHLRAGSAFYQFTYGPFCPVSKRILDRLDLRAVSIGWALANVPPAQVFRITRRQKYGRSPADRDGD